MLTDHTLGKCYLPVSLWSFQPSRSSSLLTIGLPDKQPLFHLPELLKASTAVLCSSLEEASELQKKTKDEDVAFTAFVPGIGLYEYMDLAPLQGKEVKLLISNHSGMSLAEAYLEAWKLSEYLQTKAGIGEITYLQREIEYPDMVQVFELKKLLSLHRNQPLRVVEDSILELNEAGFQEIVIKAQMEIQRKEKESKNMAFWQQKKVEEPPSLPAASSPRSLTDLMILRPYLVRGTTTVIVSEPGMGKSCFTTAICARVAGSNAPFIEERCWTRCTPKGKNYKVAYLVFDSDGDAAIADHRKDFASDLGENEDNFIVRNMAGGEINYAEEANYNAFLNLLRDIEMEQGEKGKGIDLLVIDTILAFTGSKAGKAYSIFNKLQKDFPNMAILAVHHLNKENETYGGILTTMGPRTIIKLSRTEEQKKTLNGRRPTLKDPFTLAIEKSNNNKIPEDGEAFELYLDEKNHFVVSSPKYTLQEMRKLLKEYYKDLGQRATGRLFGVGDRTIRNW